MQPLMSRNLCVSVTSLSTTIFVCVDWQHRGFVSENTQMIHVCQPGVGRLSSGHLGVEECESVGKIKASGTFMRKVGADLQMCFSPSQGWSWRGGSPARGWGNLFSHSLPRFCVCVGIGVSSSRFKFLTASWGCSEDDPCFR